jgi:hypothetical protein
MANKKFWLGILVMVLVFGMTVVGCDDSSTGENTTYKYLYVTVSGDGGSTYNPIPSNTDHNIGPYTDANSYLDEFIDGNAHTKSVWFSLLKAFYSGFTEYPNLTITETDDSFIISGFPYTDFRVKYTLKN